MSLEPPAPTTSPADRKARGWAVMPARHFLAGLLGHIPLLCR